MDERQVINVPNWNEAVDKVNADDKFVVEDVKCIVSERERAQCALSLRLEQHPQSTLFVFPRPLLLSVAQTLLEELAPSLEPSVEKKIFDSLNRIEDLLKGTSEP